MNLKFTTQAYTTESAGCPAQLERLCGILYRVA